MSCQLLTNIVLDDRIWAQTGSDWPQKGHIRDFLTSVSVYLNKWVKTHWSEKVPDVSHLGPIWPTLGPNLVTLKNPVKYKDSLSCRSDFFKSKWAKRYWHRSFKMFGIKSCYPGLVIIVVFCVDLLFDILYIKLCPVLNLLLQRFLLLMLTVKKNKMYIC